jgi:hypothetical protein
MSQPFVKTPGPGAGSGDAGGRRVRPRDTKSGEQEETEFSLEEGEIGVGGDESGALKKSEGGCEAIGVGEFVLGFEFGGEAGLFEVGGNDA